MEGSGLLPDLYTGAVDSHCKKRHPHLHPYNLPVNSCCKICFSGVGVTGISSRQSSSPSGVASSVAGSFPEASSRRCRLAFLPSKMCVICLSISCRLSSRYSCCCQTFARVDHTRAFNKSNRHLNFKKNLILMIIHSAVSFHPPE